jgi:hypothetical protein
MRPKDPFARRRSSDNAPFKEGNKIIAIGGFGHHGYEPGRYYTVISVDSSDQTVKAKSNTGSEGGWIKWCDCKKANDIGWDWLKTVLPAEALDLLAAFDGVENLLLREDLRNRLVMQIPALHDKILGALADEEAGLSAPNADAAASATDSLNELLEFEDLD